MKLLLDVIYTLLENIIYIMYLDLFFKTKEIKEKLHLEQKNTDMI